MKKYITALALVVGFTGVNVFADDPIPFVQHGGGGIIIAINNAIAKSKANLLTVKLGSRGQNVIDAQNYLNSIGYSLKVDGICGKLTFKAVQSRFIK